jgi:protein-tyrosine phosphatase
VPPLRSGLIDLHCHLLPGIDDGPATLEDALALARALVVDGVRHVVATPHVFPGRYENRHSSIEGEHARFTQALAAFNIPLSISYAGEVRLTPEVLDWLADGELPFLGGPQASTKALLLEMPDGQVPLGADRFCEHLLRQGIIPVIAHPERNRGVMERPQRLQPFLDAGCQLQLTAGSLLGEFGSKAKATALALLNAGWVHVVASDAHNLTGRAPRLKAARRWLVDNVGEATARQLTFTGPARLCGVPIAAAPAAPSVPPPAQAA